MACKHPGNVDDKDYHFTFCFKATGAIDGNLVTIGTMRVGADCREAYAGVGNKSVTVLPNGQTCLYIDAPGFTESSTDRAVLHFSYAIAGQAFQGCATGTIVGDVCGTGQPPLANNPKDWPHDAGVGDDGVVPCTPVQTACVATPCVPNP